MYKYMYVCIKYLGMCLTSSLLFHRGTSASKNLVDLGALVLHYPITDTTPSSSLPLPVSCSLIVGSQLQSIVSGSGFLGPGNYAVLPIAFNHWSTPVPVTTEYDHSKPVSRRNERDCVVSVFSSKMITYDEHVLTRPGYLAESLFLLIESTKPKSQVCILYEPNIYNYV